MKLSRSHKEKTINKGTKMSLHVNVKIWEGDENWEVAFILWRIFINEGRKHRKKFDSDDCQDEQMKTDWKWITITNWR